MRTMKIEYRNLSKMSFGELHQKFNEAFSDYLIDISYMTRDVMKNRAIKNGYDPDSSVGVFDNDKLVGFTLVGVDYHYEKPSAFDIMTGLIKEYRGKGIASEMFNFIKPRLKAIGIEYFYLEVLQENKPAIRAYKKTGFEIVRSLDCFTFSIKKYILTEQPRLPIVIKKIEKDNIDKFQLFSEWRPSWENSFTAMKRVPDDIDFYSAEYSINKLGLIVYYPCLNWIMAILVNPEYRNMGIHSALLNHLVKQLEGKVEMVKLLNIQSDDDKLITFLKQSGFELLTGQYEMKYKI